MLARRSSAPTSSWITGGRTCVDSPMALCSPALDMRRSRSIRPRWLWLRSGPAGADGGRGDGRRWHRASRGPRCRRHDHPAGEPEHERGGEHGQRGADEGEVGVRPAPGPRSPWPVEASAPAGDGDEDPQTEGRAEQARRATVTSSHGPQQLTPTIRRGSGGGGRRSRVGAACSGARRSGAAAGAHGRRVPVRTSG